MSANETAQSQIASPSLVEFGSRRLAIVIGIMLAVLLVQIDDKEYPMNSIHTHVAGRSGVLAVITEVES